MWLQVQRDGGESGKMKEHGKDVQLKDGGGEEDHEEVSEQIRQAQAWA